MKIVIPLLILALASVLSVHNQAGDENDGMVHDKSQIEKRLLWGYGPQSWNNQRQFWGNGRRLLGKTRAAWKDWRHPWGKGRRCQFKRERKEVRQMSRKEWKRFVNAINKLKKKGIYDNVAEMHRGSDRLKSCHGGPNFLGWHRIYLLILENLLRKEHPCITIPYWDSTLDYDMKDPTQSILWTDDFFGNGDFQVTSGPFANWVTGTGANLTRNIGDGGTLMTKDEVLRIMSRSNHSEIMDFSDKLHNIDIIHAGPHVWVDGQLSLLSEAAEDPVFFLHHAFVDCLWAAFQEKILREQRIRSHNDYPDNKNNAGHAPNMKMSPFANMKAFKGIKNRDAYRQKFYKRLYSCKPIPTCSASHPSCDSPFLICDQSKYRCVSKDRLSKGVPTVTPVPPRYRPAIGRGRRFVSTEFDYRTSGNPLPQKLPDSNILAKSSHDMLRELSDHLDLEVEADDNDLDIDFDIEDSSNENSDEENGRHLDFRHFVRDSRELD